MVARRAFLKRQYLWAWKQQLLSIHQRTMQFRLLLPAIQLWYSEVHLAGISGTLAWAMIFSWQLTLIFLNIGGIFMKV